MRHVPYHVWLLGALVALFLAADSPVLAQKGKFQKVKFDSPDGVELNGFWYAGSKNSPCVMILPPLGEECSKAEYTKLATTLQQAGMGVLLFDYRGVGNSTSLSNPQLFWSKNSTYAKRTNNLSIDFKDYSPKAYMVFANDIAAAKAFLDQKNDAGECNSSSLVVLGVESGATLGALWMNSECYRCRWIPPQPPFMPQGRPDTMNPAIKNIMAAIFISPSDKLGMTDFKTAGLVKLFNVPVNGFAVPTVFMYNSKDDKQKTLAETCEKVLKGPNQKLFKYTGATGIGGAKENLSGRDLLGSSLGTDKQIKDWLDVLVDDAKVNNWTQHDLAKTPYFWVFGNLPQQWMPANSMQTKTFTFDTYVRYLPTK